MTHERFDELTESLLKKSYETLCIKAKEYNLSDDRLDVFKKAAARQRITPDQALLGYMDKHIGSIYDYIHDDKKMTRALALEKIGDAINYLCLLYGVWEDKGFKDENACSYNGECEVCTCKDDRNG